MELALFVYAASVLEKLAQYLSTLTAIGTVGAFMIGAAVLIFDVEAPKFLRKLGMGFAVVACVASLVGVFVPKEKTAYMMLGAYAAQKIAESPKAEQVSEKVITLINIKLDELISNSKN